MKTLPIYEVLEELKNTLRSNHTVILEAAPGAGKTTVVPIALLEEEWLRGKTILLLEPRRLAARGAASRMSNTLKEDVGQTIGYRIRFESKVSSRTRVEVVTEGIFTRRIQSDPELKNVGLVIFDEFHERNLQTDLGLALALEVQSALRDDLKILIMSATLDGKSLSDFLSAPIVKSEGRAHPVEIRYTNESKERLNVSILSAIKKALADKGDILVFLPGSGEIRRIQKELEENFNLANTFICPLYGELSQKDQEIAINPDKSGKRKIILSTNIAESSLTIEGVGVVIDSGLCRIPRFDPSSGMTKLITTSIAKDSMTQRTGRAGRLSPGISYRIWSKEDEKHFADKTKPEILETELSQFLLEVSSWGSNVDDLKLLDKPHESSISRSKTLLQNLNLLDNKGHITELGKQVTKLPLHPRLGYMIVISLTTGDLYIASLLAAVLNEKNLFSAGHSSYRQADLALQIEEYLKNPNSYNARKIKISSEEIFKIGANGESSQRNNLDLSRLGIILSFAYPDRIAKSRERKSLRYKLSSGKGATLREHDSLIGNDFIVIAELDGDNKESAIFSAAKITLDEIIEFHKSKIQLKQNGYLEEKTGRISVFEEKTLNGLVLNSKEIQAAVTPELLVNIWKNYILEKGLSVLLWTEEAENFRMRSEFLRLLGEDLPNLENEFLLSNLDNWLLPFLGSTRRISELKNLDLLSILRSLYSYEQLQTLEKEAPERWEVPSGSKIRLEYKKDEVILSVKIQELFGLEETPRIARGKIPLTLQLLSPSQRPIQITKDIVGFWDRTYLEVKKELAGRYPRHPWPDNPRTAIATKFTKKKVY
jgi:ATP-dependent helicase HrpB